MAIGGAAAGFAGDRVGRRTALFGSMAIFGLATLAVSSADSIIARGLLAVLAGLGLGGAMPNAAALVAEYVPLQQRPIAVTVTIVCVPLGGTVAGLAAIPLLPSLGWRALFVLGGVVPLIGGSRASMAAAESPRYLARHRDRWTELAQTLRRMGHTPIEADLVSRTRDSVQHRAPLEARFSSVTSARTLSRCGRAFFSCLLAVYLGFSWLPTIITAARTRIDNGQHGYHRVQPRWGIRRDRRWHPDHPFRIPSDDAGAWDGSDCRRSGR